MSDFSEEKKKMAEEKFQESMNNVGKDEAEEAAETGREKLKKLADKIPGALSEVWENLKLMVNLIADYVKGDYKDVSWRIVTAIVAAVLYFVSPVDVIPDFIPILGYIDDAFVLGLAVKLVEDDLMKYKQWKDAQENKEE